MSHHQFPRFRWSPISLAVAALCAGLLWQLAHADHSLFQPSAALPVALHSSQPPHQAETLPPFDLAAINAVPVYYNRALPSSFNLKPPLSASQQLHDELLIVGDPFRLVLPHSWIEQPLIVQAKPGRPVTFAAPDSGKFPNGENTFTLKADEQGLAATSFFVGNEGEYRVFASSPENARSARFIIQCVTKQFRDELESGRYAQRYLDRQQAAQAQRLKAAADLAARIQRKRSGR